MKKAFLALLLLCCVVLLLWLAEFFWKNLRGAGPALKSPAADIARLMEKPDAAAPDFPLRLQPGFSLSIFARGLGDPRVMILDPADTILVSIPSEGKVVALPDHDRDGKADAIVTVIDGLNRPHGMAFRCAPDCRLYIAEKDQVNVYSYNLQTMKALKQKKIADLPAGGGHATRTLLFLPNPDDGPLPSRATWMPSCRRTRSPRPSSRRCLRPRPRRLRRLPPRRRREHRLPCRYWESAGA